MKKIVHICLNTPFDESMGYQENLLAKYHARLGYLVSVISFTRREDSEKEYFIEDEIKIIRLRSVNKNRFFRRYKNLINVLEKERPQIIFIHGSQFIDIAKIADWLHDKNEIRVYVDNHSDLFNSATNWMSKYILHKIIWKHFSHKIEPYVLKFYGVVPARVDFLKNVYKLPKEKCDLLMLGADDEVAELAEKSMAERNIRATLKISDNCFVIITGGKINQYRPEVIDLMKAVIQLHRETVKLVIFGKIAEEYQKEFDDLSKDRAIIFVGWLSVKETYEYLAMADLVFFPGLHSVMWEQAAGQGKPIVARKINGFEHIDQGGNALLIEDLSTNFMRQVISELTRGDLTMYMKMSAKAQEVKNKFSYKKIAKEAIEDSEM